MDNCSYMQKMANCTQLALQNFMSAISFVNLMLRRGKWCAMVQKLPQLIHSLWICLWVWYFKVVITLGFSNLYCRTFMKHLQDAPQNVSQRVAHCGLPRLEICSENLIFWQNKERLSPVLQHESSVQDKVVYVLLYSGKNLIFFTKSTF